MGRFQPEQGRVICLLLEKLTSDLEQIAIIGPTTDDQKAMISDTIRMIERFMTLLEELFPLMEEKPQEGINFIKYDLHNSPLMLLGYIDLLLLDGEEMNETQITLLNKMKAAPLEIVEWFNLWTAD